MSGSNLILTDQIWQQKKGNVRLRVRFFCPGGQCPIPDNQRSLHVDHVHVVGWNGLTKVPTNHTVIPANKLRMDYVLQ